MTKLKTPIEGYTGKRFGVMFVNGVAEVEDEFVASRLISKGYKVVEEEPEVVEEEPEVVEEEPETKVEDMEWNDIQALAKELGIKANQPKEELIEAIKKAQK